MLSISESIGDMIALEHLSKLVGEEYKPYDLLFGIDNISKLYPQVRQVDDKRMELEICIY